MIELRQRSARTSGYQRLTTEDEIDAVPILNNHRIPKEVRTKRSAFCKCQWPIFFLELVIQFSMIIGAKACFLFSLSGVIFLSIIAILLGSNSLYFKVSKENQNRKPKLVEGVFGAILMYLGCMGLSGYLWFKAATDREADPRFVD